MKIKFINVAFVVAIVMVGGINVFNFQKSEIELSDIVLANVEALADNELMILCDKSSVVVKCERMCQSCYSIYTAINGYGKSTGLKGTCKCGAKY